MTTTGTALFNLDFAEIAEEAFERAGSELRSGYDLKTARRSLNLLLIEWGNKGINLWTVEEGSILLNTGVATYNLPIDTVDLLDHVIRTGAGQNQSDITISRISGSTYSTIPNKTAMGKPIQVWINRQSGATTPTGVAYPTINVWPTPQAPDEQYTFVYWRLRRMQDAGNGVNTQDIPYLFLPALVAGLAYYLSMKLPGVDMQRAVALKAVYDEQFQLAADENREKAPVRMVPRMMFR
tara:strand:- start:23 stop:736 length:714 start_codon:yes stop_codon:yes gene_type:complete